MSHILLNILLAIAWAALSGNFEPVNLFFGFILSFIVLWIISFSNPLPNSYFSRAFKIVEFVLFFIFEVIKANLRLAFTILSPRMDLQPAVVAFPLELKTEAGIILLANLITLTPGSLSLDTSSDKKILFIHTIKLEDKDEFIFDIRHGFERRVRELLEK